MIQVEIGLLSFNKCAQRKCWLQEIRPLWTAVSQSGQSGDRCRDGIAHRPSQPIVEHTPRHEQSWRSQANSNQSVNRFDLDMTRQDNATSKVNNVIRVATNSCKPHHQTILLPPRQKCLDASFESIHTPWGKAPQDQKGIRGDCARWSKTRSGMRDLMCVDSNPTSRSSIWRGSGGDYEGGASGLPQSWPWEVGQLSSSQQCLPPLHFHIGVLTQLWLFQTKIGLGNWKDP